jgi:8-amino-7-oxononanoate synthase
MRSLDDFARGKLAALEARDLRRSLAPTARVDGVGVERGGKRLISFCSNDYLNLGQDPRVRAAAKAAIDRFGAGAGASRLVDGDHPLLSELERRLAAFKGAEACCVFGSGYLANSGIVPTFVGKGDLVLLDELAHSCMRAGAKLSGAATLVFRHNDMDHLAELLAAHRHAHGRCLVATDGVFSMDGDLAPLGELSALARARDAWLLVDDAHGLGVLNGGHGSTNPVDVPLQMGTLSKALGGYGGYVCASQPAIDLIKTRAASFIYTTGLPPACAASALAALDIVEGEPELVARPLAKARRFAAAMALSAPASPIVPLVVGDAARALALSRALEDEGFLVSAIRPPTVPENTSRLRVTFTAGHADPDVDRLAAALKRLSNGFVP